MLMSSSLGLEVVMNGNERNCDHTVVELGSIIDTQRLLLVERESQKTQHTPPLTNSLSKRQMESLTSLCDTFLPSSVVTAGAGDDDDSVAAFYSTSASMAGTPQRVGLLPNPVLFYSVFSILTI